MAIIKQVITPQGVAANYNRIVRADISTADQCVITTVAVYASPEAREAGGRPLWHEHISIPFSALTQDPRDLLYPMLANYYASYLKGGQTDEEGSGAPGNFEINLKPEAINPPEPPEEEGLP